MQARPVEKQTDPIKLYSTLDRKSVTGPLRPAQQNILDRWYNEHKRDRDLVIKLHTGEGKTLIGLLVLQSMINAGTAPCLYICPNIYLAKQVCEEASKFGIPYCEMTNGDIPDAFITGEKILITYAQKVFNGKSIFGIDNNYVKVASVLLDDAHACIDTIKEAQTITIKRNEFEAIYNKVLTLFRDELIAQREGSFLDVENGDYSTFMLVPYWSWYDKRTELLRILSDASNSVQSIKFVWPILRDRITEYSCYISGTEIEIVPNNPSVDIFGSFSKAEHRILMSATTQDDSFFIKGLSFEPKAVKNPLQDKEQTWSGEKMIIIPSLIDEFCDRDLIVTQFARMQFNDYGAVAIVPNTMKCEQYSALGAEIVDKKNIYDVIDRIKKEEFKNLVVINNRYDGIDLPDEACRILIIDSLPYFNSLSDRYEKKCRPNSETINKKIAQKIEQGIGRGVRGEKDYCAIIIIGTDLVKFMRSPLTKNFFSAQTQAQIEIGLDIAEMAYEDKKEDEISIQPICDLISQMLSRDDGWKEFYIDRMQRILTSENDSKIYDLLVEETEIEKLCAGNQFEKAAVKMQEYIDRNITDPLEKGWFLQQKARYIYPIRRDESIRLQKAAFKLNPQLLKPQVGIEYDKASFIHENRMRRIIEYVGKYNSYEEFILSVTETTDNLSFGVEADKFEASVKEVGELLGFISQRPDMEIRKGPDNLWCGDNNEYAFFECKSEVDDKREEITKHEAGQMNNHCGWFEKEYGDSVVVSRYMIIPTKNLSYQGDFTHEVRIIRKEKLRKLKNAIKGFASELHPFDLKDLNEETVQKLINSYKLNLRDIKDCYSEAYYKNTK